MATFMASNYDLKFIAKGVFGWGMVQIPSLVLAASIAIIGLLFGNPLVEVALVDSISLVFLRSSLFIRAIGSLSSL